MPSIIERRIKDHFKSKGSKEVMNALEIGLPGPPVLTFKDERYVTAVFPLLKEDLRDRNVLLGTVMRCTSLSGKANRIYLAIPRAYSSVIDAELLREQGIGLLTFDDKRLAEVLPPKTSEVDQLDVRRDAPSPLKDELNDLRQRICSLETALSAAEKKISLLQGELRKLGTQFKEGERLEQPIQGIGRKMEMKLTGTGGELPSFLLDNPWLEVLTERGKE